MPAPVLFFFICSSNETTTQLVLATLCNQCHGFTDATEDNLITAQYVDILNLSSQKTGKNSSHKLPANLILHQQPWPKPVLIRSHSSCSFLTCHFWLFDKL